MTRRLASATSTSSTSTPTTTATASAKTKSPNVWDDSQHPMNTHPNYQPYRQTTIPSPPSPPSDSPLPEAHTAISIGGLLTTIPITRILKKVEVEEEVQVKTWDEAQHPMNTHPNYHISRQTTLINGGSTKSGCYVLSSGSGIALAPRREAQTGEGQKVNAQKTWDDAQHPMNMHPNFITYRQTALINGITPDNTSYTPSAILVTTSAPPGDVRLEGEHTTVSIGGILTKIPMRMAKKPEMPIPNVPVSAPAYTMPMTPITQSLISRGIVEPPKTVSPSAPVTPSAYPIPIMPITQSLINRGIVEGEKTGPAAETNTVKLGFAAVAAAAFTGNADGERSDLK